MTKLVRCFVAAVVVLVPLLAAHPAVAQTVGEQILDYRVVIRIERDGTLRIQEAITYDSGVVPRHGILRDLVQRERYSADKDRR